jgi:hypothetical protein
VFRHGQLARLDIGGVANSSDQSREFDLRPFFRALEDDVFGLAPAGGGIAIGIELQFPRPWGAAADVPGAAMGVGGYTSADQVTKRDDNGLFTIGDVNRLIREGLALCRRSY